MADFPEVSIVVSNFNNGAFIDRCIRSLLSQDTSFTYEVIVVDDASDDSSLQVLKHFGSMLRVLVNNENLGLPASLNRAIHSSFGRFIVRVDSDDFVSRHFVQILALALSNNESLDAVACDYFEETWTENSRHQKIMKCDEKPIACGLMFRREHLFELGMYDPEFRFNEDKELRRRFDEKYSVTRIPIPLYRYRQHPASMSRDAELRERYDKKLDGDGRGLD